VRPRPVAFDERDDGVIRHLQLAVADGDFLARGNLHLTGHGGLLEVYLSALSAEPALNQAICSSVKVWLNVMVTDLPPALWMTTSTGLPGVSAASPRTLTRSA